MKIVLLIVAVLGIYIVVKAIGILGTNVLFSRVEGQVLVNGRPVEGADIIQTVNDARSGEQPPVKVVTDAQGNFVLEKIAVAPGFLYTILGFLPMEAVVSQKIDIVYKGKTYEGWLYGKRNYEENGEVGEDGLKKPLKLLCDLSDEAGERDRFFGVCRRV